MIDKDDELLQAAKQWFKKYGLTILVTSLITLSIGLGWYAAKRQNTHRLTQASISYEALLKNLNQQNSVSAEKQMPSLTESYPHTPYAKLAGLLLAKNLLEDGKLDLAREQLAWVMEKAEIPGIRQIARIRLARIWLSENQYEEALDTLQSVDDPSFIPMIKAVQGDIQSASNQKKAARHAYQEALKGWPTHLPGKELIQLKLQQLLP